MTSAILMTSFNLKINYRFLINLKQTKSTKYYNELSSALRFYTIKVEETKSICFRKIKTRYYLKTRILNAQLVVNYSRNLQR